MMKKNAKMRCIKMDDYEDYEDDNYENDDYEDSYYDTTEKYSEKKLTKLASDFLFNLPQRFLGLQNDMVMIYDVERGYYRLLNSNKAMNANLILVKNMIWDTCKILTKKKISPDHKVKKIYITVKNFSESTMKKFSKILYYKIILNRHLFCNANLVPKLKKHHRILLSDGRAPFEPLCKIIKKPFDTAKANCRFTSYINVSTKDLASQSRYRKTPIYNLLNELSKHDNSVIINSRKLFLELMTNTPKSDLVFTVTSKNTHILSLYITLIETILPSEFRSYYSIKDLLSKTSWLTLTNIVANITNKINTDMTRENETTQNFKTLAMAEKSTIFQRGQSYTFQNRTLLIFYGSPENLEPIYSTFHDQIKILNISLPDNIDPRWEEPEAIEYFSRHPAEILLFFLFEIDFDTLSHADPQEIALDSISPENLNSVNAFFKAKIEITGNNNDFISKEHLYEEYEKFVKDSPLHKYEYDEFGSALKAHKQFAKTRADCKVKMQDKSTPLPYFFPTRKPTKAQLEIDTTSKDKRIINGIRILD